MCEVIKSLLFKDRQITTNFFSYHFFSQGRNLDLHKDFKIKCKLTMFYLGSRNLDSALKKKNKVRIKFHGRIYQLVKEAKRNKTCNFPFSEKKKVNYLKRPIMEAEINIALKIS